MPWNANKKKLWSVFLSSLDVRYLQHRSNTRVKIINYPRKRLTGQNVDCYGWSKLFRSTGGKNLRTKQGLRTTPPASARMLSDIELMGVSTVALGAHLCTLPHHITHSLYLLTPCRPTVYTINNTLTSSAAGDYYFTS